MKLILDRSLVEQMKELYHDMEAAYDLVGAQLQFTCTGCPDNCCDSYFQHHTYIEWMYLRLGLKELSDEVRQVLLARAEVYERQAEAALLEGNRPRIMCPLNEAGRCSLYAYRLMVCRTHGVPATMTRPDGKTIRFPGCFRCQELVGEKTGQLPVMERTPLLQRLVTLEQALLHGKRQLVPKCKVTIAQMILHDVPEL